MKKILESSISYQFTVQEQLQKSTVAGYEAPFFHGLSGACYGANLKEFLLNHGLDGRLNFKNRTKDDL